MFGRKLQFQNTKTIEENLSALSKTTLKSNLSSFSVVRDGPYAFEGKVESNTFELRPVVGYRTSFLPVINGTLTKKDGKTDISVTLSLPHSIYFLLWTLTVLSLVIAVAVIMLNPSLIFLPFVILIFSWTLTAICSRMEMNDSVKKLTSIFHGKDDS